MSEDEYDEEGEEEADTLGMSYRSIDLLSQISAAAEAAIHLVARGEQQEAMEKARKIQGLSAVLIVDRVG
jgi:hypothetical protein